MFPIFSIQGKLRDPLLLISFLKNGGNNYIFSSGKLGEGSNFENPAH